MIRHYVWLLGRSAHNRLRQERRRLRQPRYVVALLLGLLYLGVVVTTQRHRGAPPAPQPWAETAAALGLLVMVGWAWVRADDRRALAFSAAEVAFLFPAPVRRRELILVKLFRAQGVILVGIVVWTLVLGTQGVGGRTWMRVLSLWVLLSTLQLHRLGASLAWAELAERRAAGRSGRWIGAVLGAGAVALAGWTATAAVLALRARPPHDWTAAGEALERIGRAAPLAVLLGPFRVAIRPLLAPAPAEWLAVIGPALLLLLVHYWWVLRSDAAFEEAALDASLARVRALELRRREGGRLVTVSGVPSRPLVPLAPTGAPARAIVWKNVTAVLRRRGLARGVAAVVLGGALLALVAPVLPGDLALAPGVLLLVWGAFGFVAGPQWVRVDLRMDLAKLDLLRAFPLRGRTIVAAETIASTAVLTLLQTAVFALAWAALLGTDGLGVPLAWRTAALAAVPLVLLPFNFAGLLLHNAAALLFPAWMPVGGPRPGRVEALGQSLLVAVGFLLGLALLCSPAAGVGAAAGAGIAWAGAGPAVAIGVGLLAGGAVLGWELRALVGWLGRVLEGTEPGV